MISGAPNLDSVNKRYQPWSCFLEQWMQNYPMNQEIFVQLEMIHGCMLEIMNKLSKNIFVSECCFTAMLNF